jgi:hypothetical protein
VAITLCCISCSYYNTAPSPSLLAITLCCISCSYYNTAPSPRLLAITLWCISCSYYNTNPVLDYWQSLSVVYPAPTTILIQSQSIGNQSLVYILLLLQYHSSPRLLAINLWCISCSYYNTNPVPVYWQSLSVVYPAPTTIPLQS